MQVAAIFINYRTAELTFRAVTALVEQLRTLSSFHVLVVDNDSRDGSFEALQRAVQASDFAEHVTVLAAPHNGGYGYGINYAVRSAWERGFEPQYFYVLNTDAFACPGSVQKLVSFMDAHPAAGLVGSEVQDMAGATQAAGFRFPTIQGELEEAARLGVLSAALRRYVLSIPPPPEDTEVDWVPGTSMLIRASVFSSGAWFDETFFLYFEEIDFAQQVRQQGWQIFTVADAPIAHHGSVSTGLHDAQRPWPDYWFDSRWRYFTKYHGAPYAFVCNVARAAGQGLYFAKCLALRRPYEERPRMLSGMARASLRWLQRPDRPPMSWKSSSPEVTPARSCTR